MLRSYIMAQQTIINNYGSDNASSPEITISSVCNSNGSYAVDDYEHFIADIMFDKLSSFLAIGYTKDDVLFAMSSDGEYSFVTNEDMPDITSIMIRVDAKRHIYGYTKISDFYMNVVYSVISIDDDDLGYLVSEYIKSDDLKSPVITKCYHPIFGRDELDAAVKYCESEMMESARMGYGDNSEFKVRPVSISSVSHSTWYELNMSVLHTMERYGIPRSEYRMIGDLNFMSEKIKADSYHSLSFDDRYEIDNMLCHRLLPYVDEDLIHSVCGEDVSEIDPSDMYDVVNMFIISALGDARSESEFYDIIDAMGAYASRIDDLNEQARYHKNEGYVLVSRTGQIKWYSNCYAINDWYGAKDNPYYHKFQQNKARLVCFSEYSPELFVDSFPDMSLIQKYDNEYKESLLNMRREHAELRFRNYPDEGMLMAIGTWYPDGVESNNRVDDAKFFAFYYGRDFDYDQAKVLFNGDEVVIDDYVSNTGDIITIKGRLREATKHTKWVNCEFYRSDQEPSARNSILMAIGAKEPQNPYA